MENQTKEHNRINWIDGMKINKSHFIGQDNATTKQLHESLQKDISAVNFGLLPDPSTEDAVDMVLSMDGQNTVHITLNRCRAVTQGGFLINITKEESAQLNAANKVIKGEYTFDDNDGECYIVLTIHPFNRIPIGSADENEEPPRHPFIIPEYTLDIIPSENINRSEFGMYHITIGKVVNEDGKIQLEEDFIPPCTSIQSHEDLKYTYVEIDTFLNAMERYSLQIVQKIFQKKQANDLAVMVKYITENVVQHLGGQLSQFRLQDRYNPPICMITKLMALARVIKNSMDVYVGTGKEELLNYLSDWCDVNQGAFENVLVEMIELEYQHTDINKALSKVSAFTKLMLSLFKKLNELDYIGKKSDSKIFVKEEIIAKNEVKNRRSFLLD
ncbi:type VI secretion system baseplate subunit TssK [Aequorivita capsosiphonis]|uniref:type VI secretion system baseplate subunit TssK n=1 Tax=Aequorivita capsosiphonis TaxID=487317 RepID=UPI0004139717|nr:type VI secretion system baseplate subunit TssK [Aequorivita capsosiphonis]